jgi:hypothetical protein
VVFASIKKKARMLIFCGIKLLKNLSIWLCYTILSHEELLLFHGPRYDECVEPNRYFCKDTTSVWMFVWWPSRSMQVKDAPPHLQCSSFVLPGEQMEEGHA